MPNCADTTHLSPEERLCQVAAILATGVLRHRQLPFTEWSLRLLDESLHNWHDSIDEGLPRLRIFSYNRRHPNPLRH